MHTELAAVPISLYHVTRANRVIASVMPRRLIESAARNACEDRPSAAVETALVAPRLLLRARGCLGDSVRLLSRGVGARNPRAACHVHGHVYMGGW